MKYQSASPKMAEAQTEKLLDLLSALVGFRCSFAWGAGGEWQVMPESAKPNRFFSWYCCKHPNQQWHSNLLDATHAFAMTHVQWVAQGEPVPFEGWEDS